MQQRLSIMSVQTSTSKLIRCMMTMQLLSTLALPLSVGVAFCKLSAHSLTCISSSSEFVGLMSVGVTIGLNVHLEVATKIIKSKRKNDEQKKSEKQSQSRVE